MAETHLHWRVGFPQMPMPANDGVMIAEVEFYDEAGAHLATYSARGGDAGNSGAGAGSSNPLQATDGDPASNVYWNQSNTNSLLGLRGPGIWVSFATAKTVAKIRVRAPDYDWANQYWPPLIRVYHADINASNQASYTDIAEFAGVPWPGQNGQSDYLEVQVGETPFEQLAPAIPFETRAAVRNATPIPIEFANAPFVRTVDAAPLPFAFTRAARVDASVPVQWSGSLAVTAEPALPITWRALVDIAGPVLYETSAPVQLDIALPFDTVLAVVVDAAVPAAWSGIAGFEAAPIHFEHVGPMYADGAIPIETGLAALVDQRMPIEYGGYSEPFTQGSFDAWHVPRRSNVWHVQRTRRASP